MPTDAVVRARIDSVTKQQATDTLAEMGLSVSDAIRILLTRIASDRAFPFELKAPNAATKAAIDALESGKGKRLASPAALFKDLGI